MGSLAEKYGYGFHDDGEMLAVADPKEAWIFEIMPVGPLWTPESGKPGAVWCAQRVPDDHVSRLPQRVAHRRDRPRRTRTSSWPRPTSSPWPSSMGYYDPKAGKPFNWKRAYSPVEGSAASTERPHPAAVALLRPRRALPEAQARDAQHGPPLLGQARHRRSRSRTSWP
ncbi:MAG: C69 family dipeptidase [Candidatus Moduliflexus flocculans]|nr:C69 family dipeptidase [Candidatus Moduliflexus flocculans]